LVSLIGIEERRTTRKDRKGHDFGRANNGANSSRLQALRSGVV